MAHVRKDTLCKTRAWWKHLKWFKRIHAKAERRAARKQITTEFGG